MVLLSVTEGEDKPLKYPTIFNSADVAVITKMDLAAAVEFDEATARANVQAVRPGMQVFTVSSKNGAGMEELFDFLVRSSAEFACSDDGVIQDVIKVRKWPVFFPSSPSVFFWACAMPQTPTM